MSGQNGSSPAPAGGVTRPPPPVPGSKQEAYEQGARLGELYGEFDAWVDKLSDLFTETSFTGGIRPWDRMSVDERQRAMSMIQRAANGLPPLPKPAKAELAAALREGFIARRKMSYEAARFLNKAVSVACQLAIMLVIDKAATPSPTMIGSIVTLNRDCAAHTASIAIREATGHEVGAERLIKTFGLPPESMYDFNHAVSYTVTWFEGVGLKLSERRGGFLPVGQGGRAGRYVLFFDRKNGGHVVYGEVIGNDLLILDGQAGKRWTNVAAAQREIGGELKRAQQITDVEFP